MSSNEQTVLGAVTHTEASKKQGLMQRLFAVWFDAFVYNQIWEDPRVDLEALQLDKHSRVLTISSGGCNALNYLLENPQRVTAVDLNRHHIYLLNLKICALKYLPTYGDFFAFFGFGKHEENIENYRKYIAPRLDADSRSFWESASLVGRMVHGKRINFFRKGGLYEHSRNGYFLRFFHKFSRAVGCKPDEILKAKTPEEQEKLYDKYIDPFFDNLLVKTVTRLPVTLFGLGIPPQQYEELTRDLDQGRSIIDVYRERAKRLAVDYPIYENYFAWQAFARKYDTENRQAVPEYLKEENYRKLKRMADRLEAKTGSVTDEIKKNEFAAFNRFIFLDAQDWMNKKSMAELWQSIADRCESGSRIIFRTAGASSPVENNLPADLLAKFEYAQDVSRELFKKDRASIYGGFHLYILK
ncbi:MAG: BtaA family protein [Pyrinomonadaceae bacterium]|nr:BtaA family protein [Pyrinomonadaceae bacterium]